MLHLLSVFFVCSGIFIAIIIGMDLRRNKQSMKIMNAVWVLTALWGSYLALWAYFKSGRESMEMGNGMAKADMKMDMKMDGYMRIEGDTEKNVPVSDTPMGDMSMSSMAIDDASMDDMTMDAMPMGMAMGPKRTKSQSIALSALHCGAGCTLADMIGEWVTFYVPFIIGGSLIIGSWVFDFILALIIGVYFQFYAIREMQKISAADALIKAFKADFFSLLSWQVGMYGWMAIVNFVLFKDGGIVKDGWTFWFMMQIAMLFGFVCAYPMNALLIKLGIKKGM